MQIDRMEVLKLWQKAKIRNDREQEIRHVCGLVLQYKADFYDPVEKALGVPWYVTGAIDCREEAFNHGRYLANGDPLWKVSTHVPRGRGPFKTWYEGAIDAFTLDGMGDLRSGGHWDVVTALIKCEGYNGWGYARMGLPSPYVWGATNNQHFGKYTADGHFSGSAWDSQPGCAAIFLGLRDWHGVDLKES